MTGWSLSWASYSERSIERLLRSRQKCRAGLRKFQSYRVTHYTVRQRGVTLVSCAESYSSNGDGFCSRCRRLHSPPPTKWFTSTRRTLWIRKLQRWQLQLCLAIQLECENATLSLKYKAFSNWVFGNSILAVYFIPHVLLWSHSPCYLYVSLLLLSHVVRSFINSPLLYSVYYQSSFQRFFCQATVFLIWSDVFFYIHSFAINGRVCVCLP